MTSSLVGSEMCIRDRSTSATPRKAAAPGTRRGHDLDSLELVTKAASAHALFLHGRSPHLMPTRVMSVLFACACVGVCARVRACVRACVRA
eukprot:4934884-Prorocentrum_lima.AAC.1